MTFRLNALRATNDDAPGVGSTEGAETVTNGRRAAKKEETYAPFYRSLLPQRKRYAPCSLALPGVL